MRSLPCVLLLWLAATGARATPSAPPAGRVLRVCADPNNLPFSNQRGEGLENALAELLSHDPAAVDRLDGPHRWPPVLYLAYARLGIGDPIASPGVRLRRR